MSKKVGVAVALGLHMFGGPMSDKEKIKAARQERKKKRKKRKESGRSRKDDESGLVDAIFKARRDKGNP